jgi:hypothetical protein
MRPSRSTSIAAIVGAERIRFKYRGYQNPVAMDGGPSDSNPNHRPSRSDEVACDPGVICLSFLPYGPSMSSFDRPVFTVFMLRSLLTIVCHQLPDPHFHFGSAFPSSLRFDLLYGLRPFDLYPNLNPYALHKTCLGCTQRFCS